MIIGVAGKKGSGKDLVGKIIQYLFDTKNTGYKISESNFNDYLKNKHDLKSDFKIVKFADKLKDLVCLLIGCTREQLEDYTFKETPLDWKTELYWVEDVDGNILGHKTTSKSKVHIDFEYYSQNNSCSIESAVIDITPRFLLTYIGTDLLREQLFDNIWVNATLSNYKPKIKECSNYDLGDVLTDIKHLGKPYPPLEYPNWVITDVRHSNEAQAILDLEGIIVQVNRYFYEFNSVEYTHVWYDKPDKSGNLISFNAEVLDKKDSKKMFIAALDRKCHSSEKTLERRYINFVIENNKGIEDLILDVLKFLIEKCNYGKKEDF